MAMVAQDNFACEVDGAPFTVAKGQVFPDKHAIVKLDGGRGFLFRRLEEEPEPARKRGRPRKTAAPDPLAEYQAASNELHYAEQDSGATGGGDDGGDS